MVDLFDALETLLHALDGHVVAVLQRLRLQHLRKGPLPLLAYQLILLNYIAIQCIPYYILNNT